MQHTARSGLLSTLSRQGDDLERVSATVDLEILQKSHSQMPREIRGIISIFYNEMPKPPPAEPWEAQEDQPLFPAVCHRCHKATEYSPVCLCIALNLTLHTHDKCFWPSLTKGH